MCICLNPSLGQQLVRDIFDTSDHYWFLVATSGQAWIVCIEGVKKHNTIRAMPRCRFFCALV